MSVRKGIKKVSSVIRFTGFLFLLGNSIILLFIFTVILLYGGIILYDYNTYIVFTEVIIIFIGIIVLTIYIKRRYWDWGGSRFDKKR